MQQNLGHLSRGGRPTPKDAAVVYRLDGQPESLEPAGPRFVSPGPEYGDNYSAAEPQQPQRGGAATTTARRGRDNHYAARPRQLSHN